MRLLATTLVLAASSAAAAAAAAAVVGSRLNSRAPNETSTTSYLAQMADTWLRRGVEKDFDYATAVLYKGLELAIEATQGQPEGGNETLAAFYEDQMSIVAEDGTIAGYNYSFYSLDDYRFGMSALYWWHRRSTGGGAERASRWRRAADRIRAMLDAHPRTASGGFWHRAPQYPNQMWLDGIFMADSFYARHTAAFAPGNASAWDDVVLQYDLVEAHCGRNATSGLLKHGYDESGVAVWADPVTGASPLVWDRADGWFFVSLLETLEVFPRAHAGHARLVGYFRSLAEGLLRAQDPASGGWWLVMDAQYAGAEGNYIESSRFQSLALKSSILSSSSLTRFLNGSIGATAMFTYGFLKGIKLGLLDEATYLAPAKKAYEMMVDRFVVKQDNGTLDWEGTVIVGSLSGNASYQVFSPGPHTSHIPGSY